MTSSAAAGEDAAPRRGAGKRVLLVVVDACATRVLEPRLAAGELPTLARLAAAGTLRRQCTSIFPSITPAATASIATGRHPRDHRILGACWYDREKDEVAYFGDDFWVLLEKGFGSFVEDFVQRLNLERLAAPTVFERAEDAGLTAGVLNFMIFRGRRRYPATLPAPLALLPGSPREIELRGPSALVLGEIVCELPAGACSAEPEGGLRHRLGFHDDATGEALVALACERSLPDLTLAYFPDNDFASHEKGPQAAAAKLAGVDRWLGEAIARWGGFEAFLDDVVVVLTGDHSQSDVLDDDAATIAADELLADLGVTDPGAPWADGHQVMVCPNLRMLQVYLRYPDPELARQVAQLLLVDDRVDQVLWRRDAYAATDDDGGVLDGFQVLTADRGELVLCPDDGDGDGDGDDGFRRGRDAHGARWRWTGDLAALDARLTDGTIVFGDYPNAFERVAGGLAAVDGGHVWATARPGYEFRVLGHQAHIGGGSHGSLHALDSTAPLLVAGAPAGWEPPAAPRITDVAPYCLRLLGVDDPGAG